MDSELIYGRLIACAIVAMSTYAIWRRIRSGRLLTAAGGLHLNILLFFGLGMLSYSWDSTATQREFALVTSAWSEAGLFLAAAYGVALLLERRSQNKLNRLPPVTDVEPTVQTIAVLIGLWMLAVMGKLMAGFAFASSGAGTIFPVLELFGYPALVVAILMVRLRQPYTVVLLSFLFAVSGYLAVTSPWRSELVLLGASVSMGLLLKGRRFLWVAPIILVFTVLILLPFANEKKLHYEQVSSDPMGALEKTIDMPIDERMQFLTGFWAKRIDGARELAFVIHGLKYRLISPRYGASYLEAVQQLVPRVLWPGKPSFNVERNYYLSRRIGLVGKEDKGTSWGINYLAETVWNFGILGLIAAVPFTFLAASWLDKWVDHNFKRPIMSLMVNGALFFVFIDLVGMVNTTTYVLWLCLVGYSVNRILARSTKHESRAKLVGIHAPAAYRYFR